MTYNYEDKGKGAFIVDYNINVQHNGRAKYFAFDAEDCENRLQVIFALDKIKEDIDKLKQMIRDA